jgi:hypothetical protein
MARVKVEPDAPDTTYIFKDPKIYGDKAGLWNLHNWVNEGDVESMKYKSFPYHDGCPTLAQVLFSHISDEAHSAALDEPARIGQFYRS